MKKNSRVILGFLTVVMLLLSSCSGNKTADAGELLGTIPSDASLVVVINAQSLLEKAGCKVSKDKITPGEDFKALLQGLDASKRADIEKLFDGETGVDPSVMAFYQVGYYYYLTGYLSDPAKFKAAIEKEKNATFATEEGIDICANVAVSNSRFWLNLEQGSIDPREVKHFTALDESQSFLDNGYASSLSQFSKDIEGWGNINGLLNTAGLSFQDRATAQVTIQTIFDDPQSLVFSFEADNGKGVIELGVLNSKSKKAKFQLPAQTLDVSAIASVGGKASALAAVCVPQKLIEKLTKETGSRGPSVFGEYLKVFRGLDGTAAIAFDGQGALNGIVTTNGKDLSQLTDILGGMGVEVVKDGNILKLSKGQLTGGADVAEMSNDFKGAMAGIVSMDSAGLGLPKMGVKGSSFMLIPDGDSMSAKVTLKGENDKENILITLMHSR